MTTDSSWGRFRRPSRELVADGRRWGKSVDGSGYEYDGEGREQDASAHAELAATGRFADGGGCIKPGRRLQRDGRRSRRGRFQRVAGNGKPIPSKTRELWIDKRQLRAQWLSDVLAAQTWLTEW
jgi:hypothetical protein